MALFAGEDLVDVQTPDGRSVRLPASVAASLAFSRSGSTTQPKPMPPPAMPPIGPQKIGPSGPTPTEIAGPSAPDPSLPQSVTGGQLVTENPLESAPAPAAPADVPVATVAPVATAKEPKPKKGAPAPVAPTKPTLSQEGYQGALDKEQAALDKAAVAGAQLADTQAAEHQALGIAYEEQAARHDQVFAEKAAQDAADVAAQDKVRSDIATSKQKIASTKIDRGSDHSIINAIGMALTTIGMAMNNQTGENPAVKAFYAALDRKVAGQMGDLDKLRADVAGKREDLADLRQKVTDRGARYDAMWAGEAEKARLQILAIGERSKSEEVKAQAKQLAAEIGIRSAQAESAAVDKQVQADQKKAQLAQEERASQRAAWVAREGQKTQERIAGAEIAYKYTALDAEGQRAEAKARAEGDAAKAKLITEARKDVRDRGIGNVATGEMLLQPEGKAKIDQAAKLEEQAAAVEKSGNASAALILRQKSENLRTEVLTDPINGVWQHRDPTQAGKLSNQYATAQTVVSLVDDINRMYTGKSIASTSPERAVIQAKITELTMQLKNAWQLGVLSKQDTALIERATGGDPTKFDAGTLAHSLGLDIGTDPEAFKKRLGALADDTSKSTYREMRANGYRGQVDDAFHRTSAPSDGPVDKAATAVRVEQTGAEAIAANEQPMGKFGAGAQKVFYGRTSADTQKDIANTQGTGLSDTARANVLNLAKLSRGGDQKVAQQAKEQLGQLAADPRLGVSVMHVLRDADPDAYAVARASVPKGETADQLTYEEQARAKVPEARQAVLGSKPIPVLAQTALEQGRESPEFKELSRQALTNPAAKAALKEITSKMGGVR